MLPEKAGRGHAWRAKPSPAIAACRGDGPRPGRQGRGAARDTLGTMARETLTRRGAVAAGDIVKAGTERCRPEPAEGARVKLPDFLDRHLRGQPARERGGPIAS